MRDIERIWLKYEDQSLLERLESLDDVNALALTFHGIFKEVMGEDLYPVSYGAYSDSVHGSWLDVRSFSLRGDGTRGFSPLYEPLRESVDHISLIVLFATMPFHEWAARVELDPYIVEVLSVVDKINGRLFDKYGQRIDGV